VSASISSSIFQSIQKLLKGFQPLTGTKSILFRSFYHQSQDLDPSLISSTCILVTEVTIIVGENEAHFLDLSELLSRESGHKCKPYNQQLATYQRSSFR